jgi:hypothetical protein
MVCQREVGIAATIVLPQNPDALGMVSSSARSITHDKSNLLPFGIERIRCKQDTTKSGILPRLSLLEVEAKVEAKCAHGLTRQPLLPLFFSHRLRMGHFIDEVVVLHQSGNGGYESKTMLTSLFLLNRLLPLGGSLF